MKKILLYKMYKVKEQRVVDLVMRYNRQAKFMK